MSSKVKHAQRSHKTYNSNNSVFVGFKAKAIKVSEEKAYRKSIAGGFIDKIKSLFRKKQGR